MSVDRLLRVLVIAGAGMVAPVMAWADAATVPATEAVTYKIEVFRSEVVGQKSRRVLVVESELKSQELDGDGKVLHEDVGRRRSDVTGVVEVKEVDTFGQVTRATLTIEQCLVTENGKGVTLLEAGAAVEIRANKAGGYGFTMGKEAASESVAKVLASLFFAYRADGPQDDRLFHAAEAWRVGEVRDMDAKVAEELARAQKADVEHTSRSGSATLKGVVIWGSEECCDFRTVLTSKPAAGEGGSDTVTVETRGLYPINKTLPMVLRTSERRIDIVRKNDEGKPIAGHFWQKETESREVVK